MSADLHEQLDLMTREQMCALLGITPATEANRRSMGKMPPSVVIGHAVFYLRSEVATWMRQHAQRRRGPGRPRRTEVSA